MYVGHLCRLQLGDGRDGHRYDQGGAACRTPQSTDFPVAALEKWPVPEVVNGLAKDSPIPQKGGVVLRVRLKDKRRGERIKEILGRAKILGKGSSTWHGLILGGRSWCLKSGWEIKSFTSWKM